MVPLPDARTTDQFSDGLNPAQVAELSLTYARKMDRGADAGAFGNAPHATLHLTALDPDYGFMAETWPYGFVSSDLVAVFKDALVKPVNTDPGSATSASDPFGQLHILIKRLGFYPHQYEQVRKSILVAFYAFLAVELATNGDAVLPNNFGSFNAAAFVTVRSVLSAHPILERWINPPSSFYDQIARLIKRNRHFASETDPEAIAQDIRRRAAAAHAKFVNAALAGAMRLLYNMSVRTWLSRQSQVDATHKSQWELLLGKATIADEDLTASDRQARGSLGYIVTPWLPYYEPFFAASRAASSGAPPAIIQDAGMQQVRRIYQSKVELLGVAAAGQEQERETHARIAAVVQAMPVPNRQQTNEEDNQEAALSENKAAPIDSEQQANKGAYQEAEPTSERDASLVDRELQERERDEQEAASTSDSEPEPVNLEQIVCDADRFNTKLGGLTWTTKKEKPLEQGLARLSLPQARSLDPSHIREIRREGRANDSLQEKDFDELEDPSEGLDATATAEECLRLLSYIHSKRHDRDLQIPTKGSDAWRKAMDEYPPIDLTVLGFRAFPLDRNGASQTASPIKLATKQLQAAVWYARRSTLLASQLRENTACGNRAMPSCSAGGVLADEPGAGKTIMAITFALLNWALECFPEPTLFVVKTSIAEQLVKELVRFVDPAAGLDVLNLTGISKDSKRLPDLYLYDESRWNSSLLVVMPQKLTLGPADLRDEAFPSHPRRRYGQVIYDEVHEFPLPAAASYQREYNLTHKSAIGLSATPIRSLGNFVSVLGFCGNTLARFPDAKAAKLAASGPSRKKKAIQTQQEADAARWHDTVMTPAKERDKAMEKALADTVGLENLFAQLGADLLPGSSPLPADDLEREHARMVKDGLEPLKAGIERYRKSHAIMKAMHHKYREGLQAYVSPPGDRHVGPFVIKRVRDRDEGPLYAVRFFKLTRQQSPAHVKAEHDVETVCIRILSKDLQRKKGFTATKAMQAAKFQYRSPGTTAYGVFHPALIAMSYAVDASAEDAKKLVNLATNLFRDLISVKGNDIADLIEIMVRSWSGERDARIESFAALIPPPSKPEERPNKVIVYCRFTFNAMLILKLLEQRSIKVFNMFGGDTKDGNAARIEAWGSSQIPVMLISPAMMQGINITQANVLIFAETNHSEPKDTQVEGRIDRMGQTKDCYIYRLFLRGSYDERSRGLGKAKGLNLLPLGPQEDSAGLLETCDVQDLLPRIVEWERVARESDLAPLPSELWDACSPFLPAITDAANHLHSDAELDAEQDGPSEPVHLVSSESAHRGTKRKNASSQADSGVLVRQRRTVADAEVDHILSLADISMRQDSERGDAM